MSKLQVLVYAFILFLGAEVASYDSTGYEYTTPHSHVRVQFGGHPVYPFASGLSVNLKGQYSYRKAHIESQVRKPITQTPRHETTTTKSFQKLETSTTNNALSPNEYKHPDIYKFPNFKPISRAYISNDKKKHFTPRNIGKLNRPKKSENSKGDPVFTNQNIINNKQRMKTKPEKERSNPKHGTRAGPTNVPVVEFEPYQEYNARISYKPVSPAPEYRQEKVRMNRRVRFPE